MGELIVSDDPVEEAARQVALAVREAIGRAGRARLAVPGGSAMKVLGAARRDLAGDASWRHVALTWVDERCVPFDDADSNRGEAYRQSQLDESALAAHELPLFEEGETPAEACARVSAVLEGSFASALDVVLLGMGEDGHIASLFVGRPSRSANALVAHVPNSPKPPPHRITLTRRMLATAESTILFAIGDAKRDALSRLLSGDATLPAVGLPGLTVVTNLTHLT